MRFLFIMDPAHTMSPERDTTFAFMRAAREKGHSCYHCLPSEISNLGAQVFAHTRAIRVSNEVPLVELDEVKVLHLAELEAVFVRKDPPFDTAYAHLTRQLELLGNRVLVINDPRSIRDANEKLFAFQFPELMPKSLVSADRDTLRAFVDQVGGRAVIKPLDGAGGAGVLALSSGDKNLRSIVDILTKEGTQLALVQEYQEAVRVGDKRVLMLDGEPLGAILRVPRSDDLRANIHAGGVVVATELTANEQRIASIVGQELRRRRLHFVGLDLIGERLIEINVTSPTGIQEFGRLTGTRPEHTVIEWVERKVRELAACTA